MVTSMCQVSNGVDEITEQPDFSIFPNPIVEYFNVSTNYNSLWSLQLFDITGREAMNEQNITSHEMKFDVSKFKHGIYLYKVNTTQRTQNGKIIIH